MALQLNISKYHFRVLMETIDNPGTSPNKLQRQRIDKVWGLVESEMEPYLDLIDLYRRQMRNLIRDADYDRAVRIEQGEVCTLKTEDLDESEGAAILSIPIEKADLGSIKGIWEEQKDDVNGKGGLKGGKFWTTLFKAIDKAFEDAENEPKEDAPKSENGKPRDLPVVKIREAVKAQVAKRKEEVKEY